MWKAFKAFAFKGNVMDMAIGVVIGGAFSSIVTSLVNDIIMPLVGILTGGIDFNNAFIALDGNTYETIAAAKEAGVAVFAYGSFISAIVDFLIIAISIFSVIYSVGKIRERREAARAKNAPPKEPEKEPRRCPYCIQEIPDNATRCPHCTSHLEA